MQGHVPFLLPKVEKRPLSESVEGYPSTHFQRGVDKNSQVRFGSTIDWNGPELSSHAQVLSNYSHQGHAGYVDEPPWQGSWKMSVIDPAADHVEEMHRDREVQTLFPSSYEEPQTKGAAGTRRPKGCFVSHVCLCFW